MYPAFWVLINSRGRQNDYLEQTSQQPKLKKWDSLLTSGDKENMGIISKAKLFLEKESMEILLIESGHIPVEFCLIPQHSQSTNPLLNMINMITM